MKKEFRFLSFMLFALSLSGCAVTGDPEDSVAARFGDKEERVIARSDGFKDTPDWVASSDTGYACIVSRDGSIQKGFKAGEKRYYCVRSEHEENATKKISYDKGRLLSKAEGSRALAEVIKQSVMSSGNTGIDDNAETSQFVLALLSKAKFSGLRQAKQYWEKKTSINEDGIGIKVHFYTLSYISEDELKKNIDDLIKGKEVSQETKAMMKKAADALWEDERL